MRSIWTNSKFDTNNVQKFANYARDNGYFNDDLFGNITLYMNLYLKVINNINFKGSFVDSSNLKNCDVIKSLIEETDHLKIQSAKIFFAKLESYLGNREMASNKFDEAVRMKKKLSRLSIF